MASCVDGATVPLAPETLAVMVYRLGAEQAAVVPPPMPWQLQVCDEAPVDTAVAVPAVHSPLFGAFAVPTPFAAPQLPLATAAKVAVTAREAVKVRLQVPVPVQSPLQLPKDALPPVLAVSVMAVPAGKLALQVPVVQLMPEGLEVTVPAPSPAMVTASDGP